ncbi:TlpA family protein disulfide reductase [Enhygromyxa salina]|uniref:TlpA family protein disulfide reductase n=1 Tax=Enhygromyxa salina TaxID=215803 RepID=UPI0015E70427|nr:TlpA disulfide reductase family protein [Enhygromyxa salina]
MTIERSTESSSHSLARPRSRSRLSALALASSLVLGFGCKTRSSEDEAAEHTPAPEFATKNLDGDDVSLADLKGQVVLLNVWATWCDPCVRELPELARMHESLKHKGFTVIGLNTDVRSKLAAVRTMVIHHALPFPIWLDFESKSQVALKLRGYPTSFLIDRQGNVRWKREGEITKNDPELGAVLETVLAE